jgi:hypothetical protein
MATAERYRTWQRRLDHLADRLEPCVAAASLLPALSLESHARLRELLIELESGILDVAGKVQQCVNPDCQNPDLELIDSNLGRLARVADEVEHLLQERCVSFGFAMGEHVNSGIAGNGGAGANGSRPHKSVWSDDH